MWKSDGAYGSHVPHFFFLFSKTPQERSGKSKKKEGRACCQIEKHHQKAPADAADWRWENEKSDLEKPKNKKNIIPKVIKRDDHDNLIDHLNLFLCL
jgi:hypothetical protein